MLHPVPSIQILDSLNVNDVVQVDLWVVFWVASGKDSGETGDFLWLILQQNISNDKLWYWIISGFTIETGIVFGRVLNVTGNEEVTILFQASKDLKRWDVHEQCPGGAECLLTDWTWKQVENPRYCWWKKSGEPVEVGRISHYWQGFLDSRWCRISSINSICT